MSQQRVNHSTLLVEIPVDDAHSKFLKKVLLDLLCFVFCSQLSASKSSHDSRSILVPGDRVVSSPFHHVCVLNVAGIRMTDWSH